MLGFLKAVLVSVSPNTFAIAAKSMPRTRKILSIPFSISEKRNITGEV